MKENPLFVICLAGPTGAGKTALALELAARMNCEIINADSRQLYADFPIITAQPTDEERTAAAHHLYGFLPTSQKSNACFWAETAAAKAAEIAARGAIPLLVGGTGLYFQALLHGMSPIPPIPLEISRHWRQRILEDGPEQAHALLAGIDPAYAAKIHPHDRQRVQRALEVHGATGKNLSWWHARGNLPPFASGPLFMLDFRLDELSSRLLGRIDQMIANSALDEARHAWEKCPDAHAPGWTGIGCAEILSFLQGKISMDECRRLWHANTRAYAKRQLTWFKARKEAIRITSDISSILRHLHALKR